MQTIEEIKIEIAAQERKAKIRHFLFSMLFDGVLLLGVFHDYENWGSDRKHMVWWFITMLIAFNIVGFRLDNMTKRIQVLEDQIKKQIQ